MFLELDARTTIDGIVAAGWAAFVRIATVSGSGYLYLERSTFFSALILTTRRPRGTARGRVVSALIATTGAMACLAASATALRPDGPRGLPAAFFSWRLTLQRHPTKLQGTDWFRWTATAEAIALTAVSCRPLKPVALMLGMMMAGRYASGKIAAAVFLRFPGAAWRRSLWSASSRTGRDRFKDGLDGNAAHTHRRNQQVRAANGVGLAPTRSRTDRQDGGRG